jgi:hypothetical protein
MDRNLGALIVLPTGGVDVTTGRKAIGLQYQWGRKDPIPTDQTPVYRNGSSLNATQYNNSYTKLFSAYGAAIGAGSDKKHVKIAKVLQYSIENPLAYLYNNGGSKDWISNETGQAPERWGHATEKSPFDPCPDGWRVPDVSFPIVNTPFQGTLATIGVKGTSPWYLGRVPDPKNAGLLGIDQTWNNDNSATQAYKGYFTSYSTPIAGWVTQWAGWIFNNPDYNIGNYPVTGVRGELSNAVATNFPRVSLWTAAMAEPTTDPTSPGNSSKHQVFQNANRNRSNTSSSHVLPLRQNTI